MVGRGIITVNQAWRRLRDQLSRLGRRALAAQITLFDSVNQSLLDELRGLDVETLTGDEARQLLLGLKNRIV